MNLAKFFDDLSLQRVASFVEDQQEEHLSLEFKTAPYDLKAGSDKKNFAEALSGFANSAGGILVWGIRTSQNAAGLDVANALVPIVNIAKFVVRLSEFTSLLVSPIVPGVINKKFEGTDGSGFAATLIPESDGGPHMALAGHHRYFKRAGDRFYRMEHFDVSDMFGRRQRPVMGLAYSLHRGSSMGGPEGSKREIRILLRLSNEGRASAVAPFARIHVHDAFRLHPTGVTSHEHGANLQMTYEPSQHPVASVVGNTDVIIHPKVPFQIAELTNEYWDHKAIPSCRISYIIAAMNTESVEDDLVIPASEIASTLERHVEAGQW